LPGARRLRRRRRWRRRRRRCARDDRPRGLRDRRGGGAVSITEIPRPTSARPEATGPASTTDPSATAPADGPRTLWDRPGVRAAAGALLPLLILAAWQLVTSTGLVPAYRLPGPLTVLQAGADLASRGELGLHIAISVQRVLLGFAAGAAVGLAAAAVVGLSRAGDALLNPTLAALRA